MSEHRPQHVSTIHVWDDPDSKINFLERTLHGKDWRTTIVYPDKDHASLLKREATKMTLEGKGYIVKDDIDDCGHPILQVHHTGDGTNLFDVYDQLGLVKGTMHIGGHPMLPLRYMLRGFQNTVDALTGYVGDPARANGLIYTAAEVILSNAGKGEKTRDIGHAAEPHLLSWFGRLCLVQSVLYLALSRTNDELALQHLHKKIHHSQKAHGDLSHLHYDKEEDKDKPYIGKTFVDLIRKYPVQIGALFNDAGMALYLVYAIMHRHSTKMNLDLFKAGKLPAEKLSAFNLADAERYLSKGFYIDIARPIISAVAWSSLLIAPKKHDEHSKGGLLEKLQENPQYIAGVGTLASSSLGLWGASSRGNIVQQWGERLYLLGDFSLFFTKSDEYGGGHEQDLKKLGKKISEYMHTLPVVFGPETRRQFTYQIAEFVIEKDLAEKRKAPITRTELAHRVDTLANFIREHTERLNPHLSQISEAAGSIAAHFPTEARAQAVQKIAVAIKAQEGVYATEQELQQAITESAAYTAAMKEPRQSKLVQMKDISDDVAKLAFAVPGLDAAATASAIYDALNPFTRAHASDQRTLARAMTARAAGNLGIPLHELPGVSRAVPGPVDHVR